MYNNFQMKFKIHYLFVLFTFITACAVEEYDISDTTPLEVTQPETIIINDMVEEQFQHQQMSDNR